MQGKTNAAIMWNIAKSILLISGLIVLVLLLNKPLIDFDFLHPEQGILYIANQRISSIWDLIDIYLHPQMMAVAIPFFRPSGHFLIYQILYQFLDPRNFHAFIVVNFIFLALSGYLLIRIYPYLFPTFKMGGWIAFAIFLMHPALILSRLMSLHFEFAYTFFFLLSLYCLIRFSDANGILKSEKGLALHLKSFAWFYFSVFFYILSVTFKEPALLLGPALALFLFIFMSRQLGPIRALQFIFKNRDYRNIFLLLGVVSISLLVYMTLPWPTSSNPIRETLVKVEVLSSAKYLLFSVFDFGFASAYTTFSQEGGNYWRRIAYPFITSLTLWVLIAISIAAYLILRRNKDTNSEIYKKSILFLILSSLLYLILPLGWGIGYPWHFNLTILMLSLIAGFSCDYIGREFFGDTTKTRILCAVFAFFIAFQVVPVNKQSLSVYLFDSKAELEYKLLRNAILHPPKILQYLNSDSIILIEDGYLQDGYVTSGGSFYPFSIYGTGSYDVVQKPNRNDFIKLDPSFSGVLFRWAYLMPTMREASYPFDYDKLLKVDDKIIYQWLLEYNNIFSLGYDKKGEWHDHTKEFRKNLLEEKKTRKIEVNAFEVIPWHALQGSAYKIIALEYPDQRECQYYCDQDIICRGFTYKHYEVYGKRITKCDLYQVLEKETKLCPACTSYVKT